MSAKLKISILTPSFNTDQYIEENILSVLNQDYKNVEHIVIDGGSTDNTVEILKKYPHLKWVSEKDKGQSDALNKGLAIATGDIIGWLNSDDFYEENIFADVIKHFKDSAIDWIIGNSIDYYEQHGAKRVIVSKKITYNTLIKNTSIVRQPPTFFRKSLIVNTGFVDKAIHYVMDYELWLRLSKKTTPKMINKIFATFRIHSAQKTSALNKLQFIHEKDHILKNEGISYLKRKQTLYKDYKTFLKTMIKMVLIKIGLIEKTYLNIPYSTRKFKNNK